MELDMKSEKEISYNLLNGDLFLFTVIRLLYSQIYILESDLEYSRYEEESEL